MQESRFERTVSACATLLYLSERARLPLRQIVEDVGPQRLLMVLHPDWGSHNDHTYNAWRIRHYFDLDYKLHALYKSPMALRQTSEMLASLTMSPADVYGALTSGLAAAITRIPVPEHTRPHTETEVADFYSTLLQLGQEAGVDWTMAPEEEMEKIVRQARRAWTLALGEDPEAD